MIVVFLVCIQSSLPTECQKRAHRYSELRSYRRVMHVGNSLSQTEVHVSYAQFSPRTNSSCVLLTQRNEDQGTQRTRTSLSPMLKFMLYSLQTMECHLRPIENTLGRGGGGETSLTLLSWNAYIELSYIHTICFRIFDMIWLCIFKTLDKIELHALTWAEDRKPARWRFHHSYVTAAPFRYTRQRPRKTPFG